MDLFACKRCNTVDALELIPKDRVGLFECTLCLGLPWHNKFEAEQYDPDKDLVINRPNGFGLG